MNTYLFTWAWLAIALSLFSLPLSGNFDVPKGELSPRPLPDSIPTLTDSLAHLVEAKKHEEALQYLAAFKTAEAQSTGYASEINRLWGVVYYEMGQGDSAIHYFKSSLAAVDTSDYRQLQKIKYSLAKAYSLNRDYEASIAEFQDAIENWKCPSKEDSSRLAWAYNDMGNVYPKMSQPAPGLEAHQKALEIRRAIFPEEHEDIIKTYVNIGYTLMDLGDFVGADSIFEEAQARLARTPDRGAFYFLQILGLIRGFNTNQSYDKALATGREALRYEEQIKGEDKINVAYVYNAIGVTYRKMGAFYDAIDMINKSMEIKKSFQYDGQQKDLEKAISNLGNIYFDLGAYQKAIYYQKKALDFCREYYGEKTRETAYAYHNLGIGYLGPGDYRKAIDCFLKSIELKNKTIGERHPDVALSYLNIGVCYGYLGLVPEALEHTRRALEIIKEGLGETHPYVFFTYTNFGELYLQGKDYPQAIEYSRLSYDFYTEKYGEKYYEASFPAGILGEAYLEQGDFQQAEFFLRRFLEIFQDSYGIIHPETAKAYQRLAKFHSRKNDFVMAGTYLDSAQMCIQLEGTAFTDEQTPSIRKLDFLITKNRVVLDEYSQAGNPALARQFLASIEAAFDEREKLNQLLISPESKRKFNNEFLPFLPEAFRLAKSLDDPDMDERAFNLLERTRALSLYQAMQEANALHFAGIPDGLLELEDSLRIDITFYDKQRQEKLADGLAETDTSVLAISSKLFDLKQAYEALKARFETEYPEYYNLKYNLSTASVQEIQDELLDDGQALLEYLVGDSSIFIFAINKDGYQIHEVKRDFPLEAWVEQLRRNISRPHAYTLEAYAEVARNLYEKLLAPVAAQLPDRIIILPDGILGHVPFEALLTEAPANAYEPKYYPYLLRRHEISYSYSATLLREMKHKKHRQPPVREMLAMAPFAGTDTILTSHLDQSNWFAGTRGDTLLPLPWTRIELDSLMGIFQTDAFYGRDATEERFANLAGAYRILHLPTHGKADSRAGDYSYLTFAPQPASLENGLLYVRDLYNLSLNADLVTLSACETAAGELQRGEGIISLARAFAYAGAKSIATTLWQVNDRSTQELMVRFYHHLKAGLPKDEALRQAKLDYLDEHSGTEAHPCFWAPVIGIGDMAPLCQN
ncbi:MAG: CHAT domain-containing protein [Phaeodactylibacter sp.]|nr:CHAT domain-containing protein [Phaeodactylibacter sp.]